MNQVIKFKSFFQAKMPKLHFQTNKSEYLSESFWILLFLVEQNKQTDAELQEIVDIFHSFFFWTDFMDQTI